MLRNRIKLWWLLVSFIFAVFISACGQKGDLYHPDEQSSSLSSPHLSA